MNRIKEEADNKLYSSITSSEFSIPISVFSTSLSPLESLVKFLRETYGWNFQQIGRMIGRDSRNLSAAYRKVKHVRIVFSYTTYTVPLARFQDKKLSVLEHVVNYLYNQGVGRYKIAQILNKNTSTIYTVMERVNAKLEEPKLNDKLSDVIKYLHDKHNLTDEEISRLLKVTADVVKRTQGDTS